jgi:hypothetical protein
MTRTTTAKTIKGTRDDDDGDDVADVTDDDHPVVSHCGVSFITLFFTRQRIRLSILYFFLLRYLYNNHQDVSLMMSLFYRPVVDQNYDRQAVSADAVAASAPDLSSSSSSSTWWCDLPPYKASPMSSSSSSMIRSRSSSSQDSRGNYISMNDNNDDNSDTSTTVVIYCNVSSYVVSSEPDEEIQEEDSNKNNMVLYQTIRNHVNITLMSINNTFIDLPVLMQDNVINVIIVLVLDGKKTHRKLIDTIQQKLEDEQQQDDRINKNKKKIVVFNVWNHYHQDDGNNNDNDDFDQQPAFGVSRSLHMLTTVTSDTSTTTTKYMLVVHSNQPFSNPPYRYMAHAFSNRRKKKVPLDYDDRDKENKGGVVVTSEPPREIHLSHSALCHAVRSYPNQLASRPVRFVSSSYASTHYWDSGVLFTNSSNNNNDCHHHDQNHQNNNNNSSSTECHDDNGHEHHLPTHLVVNDDTTPTIVDDPELYYQYLTNADLYTKRLQQEKKQHNRGAAAAINASSLSSSLHFFRSYDGPLENENHFCTTSYYKNKNKKSKKDDDDNDDNENNNWQYVYGRPFVRHAHFLYAYVYAGEIYVDNLDKTKK